LCGLEEVVEAVLSRDIESVDRVLSVKDSVREEVIKIVREIVRASGEAIRRIHLGDYSEAASSLAKASEYVSRVKELLKNHPDLYYSGLVYSGLAEYAEARIVYSLVVEKKMPSLADLDIPITPYLQGLGDVVGELRRHVLTLLDRGELSEARTYLNIMERIYTWLRKLNYPDPLTPGLRHKVDVARKLVEDTRTIYIYAKDAHTLAEKLGGKQSSPQETTPDTPRYR